MAIPLAIDARTAASAYGVAGAGRVGPGATFEKKARATAQEFEAAFLNTVFQTMFAGVGEDGPMGGGEAKGLWRSFLTDEYAKTFAKAGGVGLADHVYRALLERQAAHSQ